MRNFQVYLLVFFCAMFVSMLAKRVPRRAAPALSRSFFFSPRNPKGLSHGWSAPDTAPPPAVSPVLLAANYDRAMFDKFVGYQVAVAFEAKNRSDTNVFRRKKAATVVLALGEDNLFVLAQADGYLAVGVADGVGGWAEAGYDLLAILRELCLQLKSVFEAGDKALAAPSAMLAAAFEQVLALPRVEIGGTTACLGVLTPDRQLRVANLGDLWCGLFRDHQLVKETQFQTHNFNTPYQLAKVPAHILRQAELQGKKYIIDLPELCDQYVWDLQKDDIVVFATDGVTDNVVPQDMELFLRDQAEKNTPLPEVATRFVQEVVKVSKDPNFPSAFAQELLRLTGQRYLGGKEDDITVVMVRVL